MNIESSSSQTAHHRWSFSVLYVHKTEWAPVVFALTGGGGEWNNVLYIFLILKSLYDMPVLSWGECDLAAPLQSSVGALRGCESRRKERKKKNKRDALNGRGRDNGFSVARRTISISGHDFTLFYLFYFIIFFSYSLDVFLLAWPDWQKKKKKSAKMQQPFSTFIHVELCDSLCWCLS